MDAYIFENEERIRIRVDQAFVFPPKFFMVLFSICLGTIVLREIENIAYVEFWTENKEYYRFLSKDYFTYLSNEPVVNAFVSTRILISQIIRESFTCDGQR